MARPRTGKALSAAERMRRYRARRRAPGAARDAVLRKASLIRSLARAHGASSVALFGSAARGEEGPRSDLDFIVELESGRSLLDLIGLADDLEAILGRKVETVTKAGMKPRVLAAARKDAVRIV
jgi:predicted nucleotidyltransferase